MADAAKVRSLLEAVTKMSMHFNEDEITRIARVVMDATDRIVSEVELKGDN